MRAKRYRFGYDPYITASPSGGRTSIVSGRAYVPRSDSLSRVELDRAHALVVRLRAFYSVD